MCGLRPPEKHLKPGDKESLKVKGEAKLCSFVLTFIH